jgi:peptidoglycan hydrolase-like protein with peptidoglycan-binding domain
MTGKRTVAVISTIGLLLIFQCAALAAGEQPTASPAASAQATPAPEFKRTLQSGCKGDDVTALQARLAELGYFSGEICGTFGPATKDAVKTFQKDHGLAGDGVVGGQTFALIYGVKPQFTFYRMKITNSADERPFLLKKGKTGDDVEDLQKALTMKGFYTGKINGVFDAKTKTAVIRFQGTIRDLKADGLAGNYTLASLYTLLDPPDLSVIQPWPEGVDAGLSIPIEKLEWEYVSSEVFTKGMDAVIVDVRTGYIFNVRFVGGHNHADVEPLTNIDAATFYKAAGGFSWDRRPIWVIVQGRRLAASMNCMPHGYDSIPGNDFVGQLCVHFIGSKGHESNKVDPAHQACIEEAYEAGMAMKPTPSPTPEPTPTPSPTPEPAPTAEPGLCSDGLQAPMPANAWLRCYCP